MCRAPSCLCASLLTQSGRGEKLASGKTHDVGVGREKQARKPTLEAYCWVAGRKVGVERNWQAEKPTAWVQEEKSKQEKPSRKLVARLWRKKWARREAGKRKNPRRGRRKREASEKTHPGSLSLGYGGKSGRGEKQASGKTHDVGVGREK